MAFRLQTMKQALRQPLFVCSLPLAVVFLLFVASVPYSVAEGEQNVIVVFEQEAYGLTLRSSDEQELTVEVKLSAAHDQDITVTYEVTSDDATADDVDPLGDEQLVIPADTKTGEIKLKIKPNQAWKEGTKTVKIKLTKTEVESGDSVGIGQPNIATITITREQHRIFLPGILNDKGWKQFDRSGTQKKGVRSLTVCPGNSPVLYLGTDEGLFQWKSDTWEKVPGNVPGGVREIAFDGDCSHVYAAVLGSGVWGKADDDPWCLIGEKTDADKRQSSFTVIVRGNFLYTGTEKGIYYYNLNQNEHCNNGSWTPTLEGSDIARLTLAGGRIFAAVWQEGVSYDDTCGTAEGCKWTNIPGPENDKFVRDVIGRPPINDGGKPDWLLFATATTVYWWDDKETGNWSPPGEGKAPQPTGNVFSLAGNHGLYYAGVESGGVWVTKDAGRSWIQVGDPEDTIQNKTVRDIAITDDKLYAATFENGVWVLPLPKPNR